MQNSTQRRCATEAEEEQRGRPEEGEGRPGWSVTSWMNLCIESSVAVVGRREAATLFAHTQVLAALEPCHEAGLMVVAQHFLWSLSSTDPGSEDHKRCMKSTGIYSQPLGRTLPRRSVVACRMCKGQREC